MNARVLKIALIAVILMMIATPVGLEIYTSKPAFCGSCHIMKTYFNTWENSKHRTAACVDCHYAPGKQHTLTAKFKGLSQLFSYVAEGGETVRKRAFIDDTSCTTSNCHPQDKKFLGKKVKFSSNVSYVHNTHFDKTVEGQKLHCATCHGHVSSEKHFEVTSEVCYICHFKNTEFNKGRSRCALCHEISDKPLQKQFADISTETSVKPITHKSMEEAGVSCTSCHIDLVRGDGAIKEDDCLDCHETGPALKKVSDKKLMHEKHVAGQEANCRNCHSPIIHKEATDLLEVVRSECARCHPDHHLYQKALLTGEDVKGIAKTPALMTEVNTNCLACHTKRGLDAKGQVVLKGAPEACVACHTKEHEKMLEEWREAIKKELTEVVMTGTEAGEAFEKAKAGLSEEDRNKFKGMLDKGTHYIHIIERGHGVHNKKYSFMLIDEALNNFEDLIDELKE